MTQLELLYAELVERSNFLKSAEAIKTFSDLEIEIRERELIHAMLIVQQRIIAGHITNPLPFSKN